MFAPVFYYVLSDGHKTFFASLEAAFTFRTNWGGKVFKVEEVK